MSKQVRERVYVEKGVSPAPSQGIPKQPQGGSGVRPAAFSIGKPEVWTADLEAVAQDCGVGAAWLRQRLRVGLFPGLRRDDGSWFVDVAKIRQAIGQYAMRDIGLHMYAAQHSLVSFRVKDLKLGYSTEGGVDFTWKPYEIRSEQQRTDFDRLRVSIEQDGIQKPLITYKGHVLIGMRRCEIAQKIGRPEFVLCAAILEDVSQWRTEDLERLAWLRLHLGEYAY